MHGNAWLCKQSSDPRPFRRRILSPPCLRTFNDGSRLWIRATHGHSLKSVDANEGGLYTETRIESLSWSQQLQSVVLLDRGTTALSRATAAG